MSGLGFSDQDLGFASLGWDSGFTVWGLRSRAWGLEFQSVGAGVGGLGFLGGNTYDL